jgi:ABC-2 type transport system permease protein
MKTIKHIITKEFLQFKRDPKMFAIILVAPVIQLIFLGYAVNMDVNNVTTVLFDQDRSQKSRELIERFEASGYFEFVDYVTSYDQVEEHINDGDAMLGIVIPYDFEESIGRGASANLQTIIDASDGNKASITMGYIQQIAAKYSGKLLVDMMNKRGMTQQLSGNVDAELRAWYNPELKTRVFMVPAIVGLLLSLITLILTSLAIVKEKEVGTLEQIIVTPIKPIELLIGKLVPFAILGFAAIAIVLSAMAVVFGIAVQGSILFLFFSSFIYILSTLGLGLFVSTISKTQQQAMMLAMFLVLMPMIFLSGFAFPIVNMPPIIQGLTYFVPLRYFMTIIRGVIIKGVGFAELWPQVVVLFVFGILIMGLSARRFQKRLD